MRELLRGRDLLVLLLFLLNLYLTRKFLLRLQNLFYRGVLAKRQQKRHSYNMLITNYRYRYALHSLSKVINKLTIMFIFFAVPSPRPCRMYFLETIGEIIESAWVPGTAVLPFEGGHQFNELPVLRRRGKQKEKDYKYTVNSIKELAKFFSILL